ncbi:MAG: adenosylcobinamide-GDP ribazoletransferase [Frankia sp.]
MIRIRLAFSFLTIIPVRGPDPIDRRLAGNAMTVAPLVGFVLGFVAASVVIALRILVGSEGQTLIPAVAGIAVLALLTRGLHLDGLADLADGLGASRDPERSLAVMKQPDIGAFGAATMVFVVLGQVAALEAAIAEHRGTVSLILAVTVSRLAVTWACLPGAPAARPGGLGALVAGSVRPVPAGIATVLVALGAAFAGLNDFHGGRPGEAIQAVLALAATLLVTMVLRAHLVHRLGGVTGDVFGALIEVATLVTLLAMAVHLPLRIRDALDLP